MPSLDSRNFLNDARVGQIRRRHGRDHHAIGTGDVERICAEMAGTVAGRHSDRARTFCVLFSDRYLHHSQHPAQLAIIDIPALGEFITLLLYRSSHGPAAGLILHVVRACANGPQGRACKNHPNSTRSACERAAAVPSLLAHEIHASLRRRNCERRNDHWSGTWPARTGSAKTLCAYCRQDTFSLVRRILRDERSRSSIENLFRGRLSVFSRKKFWRHRSCSGSR